MNILIVPSILKGRGTGHLVRCLALARGLGPGARVYIPDSPDESSWSRAEISLAYGRELSGIVLAHDPRPPRASPDRRADAACLWDLVILDQMSVSREQLGFWEKLGPVLCLDEGGSARSAAHYLIDCIPGSRPPGERIGANFESSALLDLPSRRRERPSSFRRILISFGGEDPAGLAAKTAGLLIERRLAEPSDLSILSGALTRENGREGLGGCVFLGHVQDLKEHLHAYDLVITQFGLTAFEAAWAGAGVILVNPTSYHVRLGRSAGFPEASASPGRPDFKKLRRLMANPADLLDRCEALLPRERGSLAGHIAALRPAGPMLCPLCGNPERRILYRDPGKSYFRCGSCGTIYLSRFSAGRESPYNDSYFFEEYKKQYGKSYLEDWDNIRALAAPRLGIIASLLGERARPALLLDVGCAYGPFLDAAREQGMEVRGLDIAEGAVRHVRERLGIPAMAGDFSDPELRSKLGGPFDALTMWYVIEHFERLDSVLSGAFALLAPGGVLAFAAPSGEGVCARLDSRSFFAGSPDDHFSILKPSLMRRMLAAHGFALRRIRVTGHHPERMPLLRLLNRRYGRLPRFLRVLGLVCSKCLSLGDTFEVYAVREPGPAELSLSAQTECLLQTADRNRSVCL